jgi:deoxyhypusine monooxygenase
LTAPHQKFRLSLDRKSWDSLIYTHSSTSLRFFFHSFRHQTPTKMTATETSAQDGQVHTLRKILVSEQEPLARRFRALFSLKYLASLQPPSEETVPAIEAIAAGFGSPSALLKHELAYCLGQSRHDAAIAPLRAVLQDKDEDTMCRHEAAEALGALSDKTSLELLKEMRDNLQEPDVIRETCDIAVDRIEWDHGLQKGQEQIKKRYGNQDVMLKLY